MSAFLGFLLDFSRSVFALHIHRLHQLPCCSKQARNGQRYHYHSSMCLRHGDIHEDRDMEKKSLCRSSDWISSLLFTVTPSPTHLHAVAEALQRPYHRRVVAYALQATSPCP